MSNTQRTRFFTLGETAYQDAKKAGQIHGNSTDLIRATPQNLHTDPALQVEHSQFVSGFKHAGMQDRAATARQRLAKPLFFDPFMDQQFANIFGAC